MLGTSFNKHFRSSTFTRSLCSAVNSSSNYDNLVLVEERASSRTVILNRPHVLNALNTPMGILLNKLYESWERDPTVDFVVIKGNGRAFCSGGDVVKLYQLQNEGRVEECKECFRTLYSFMYHLATYLKPNVAILDGITMGGGAGISVHGSYRVATENTVFCVPEVLIGFHPDAGASYYLSRLPGYLGEYLALTADMLVGEEMFACGLATHYSPSRKLQAIEKQLSTLAAKDFSVMETFLARFNDPRSPNSSSVLHRMEMINKCFGHDTVEEIINVLEGEAARSKDKWCISTLKKLRSAPPLSLKVALRSIRKGRFQTLEQCFAREYRMSLQAITKQISNDFSEGVRARLVDKCFSPKWDPSSLEKVSEDMVDAYFSPINAYEPELDLSVVNFPEASQAC
ncbi:hypothetical protein PTKIN_Ptkin04bG0210900 [Pterospermum kingtungense]